MTHVVRKVESITASIRWRWWAMPFIHLMALAGTLRLPVSPEWAARIIVNRGTQFEVR